MQKMCHCTWTCNRFPANMPREWYQTTWPFRTTIGWFHSCGRSTIRVDAPNPDRISFPGMLFTNEVQSFDQFDVTPENDTKRDPAEILVDVTGDISRSKPRDQLKFVVSNFAILVFFKNSFYFIQRLQAESEIRVEWYRVKRKIDTTNRQKWFIIEAGKCSTEKEKNWLYLRPLQISLHSKESVEVCFNNWAFQNKNGFYYLLQRNHLIRKHCPDTPALQCSLCNVKFAKWMTLNFYMRRKHTGKREHKCKECSESTV